MTLEEAIKSEFKIGVGVFMPAKSCKYCSETLQALYRRAILHKVLIDFSGYRRCQCEESQKAWEIELAELEQQMEKERETKKREDVQRRVDKLFAQSKLGERFKTRTFENFITTQNNKKAFEIAKKFADEFETSEFGVGLNFMGCYGTGKTHLAAAIAISLINKGVPVVFGTLINLLGKIKATYEVGSKMDEDAIISLYNSVDLLIIDDLGKEKPSEWVLEKLYTIINQRYENFKPIVITTNYDADRLIERLTVRNNTETAEAIVSRLHEACKWVVLSGEDYRTR
jgi:DNA replication protein DnaC